MTLLGGSRKRYKELRIGTPLPEAPSHTQASGTHSLVVLELESDGEYNYGFINPDAYRLPDGWSTRYVKDLAFGLRVPTDLFNR